MNTGAAGLNPTCRAPNQPKGFAMTTKRRLVPSGCYSAIITGWEQRPHPTTPGRCYHDLHMVVTSGPYVGHRLHDQLHAHHKAPKKARETGERKLQAIRAALDLPQRQSVAELAAYPLLVKVEVASAWDDRDWRFNRVVGYGPLPS